MGVLITIAPNAATIHLNQVGTIWPYR